jgi:hypothetical protein
LAVDSGIALGHVVQGPADVDEAADDEGAAGRHRSERAAELGPVGADGNLLVDEHGGAAGGGQFGADGRGVVDGAGAGVTDGGHSSELPPWDRTPGFHAARAWV